MRWASKAFALSRGGSLGGMQALEWAASYPEMVRAIVPIASTHALSPQGVAWNAVARNAITADPDWQQGHYYGTARAPNRGMGIARMVGTYHLFVGGGDEGQVRPPPAKRRGPRLRSHSSRSTRSKAISAIRRREVRQAIRREPPISTRRARSHTSTWRNATARVAWSARCGTSRLKHFSSASAPIGSTLRRIPERSPERSERLRQEFRASCDRGTLWTTTRSLLEEERVRFR